MFHVEQCETHARRDATSRGVGDAQQYGQHGYTEVGYSRGNALQECPIEGRRTYSTLPKCVGPTREGVSHRGHTHPHLPT